MSLSARLCVAALVLSFATAAAAQVGFLHDPVVTYTNGMRLASTTSQRSHNVYWRCDEQRTGYCDCRMHGCLRNDLRSLGTRRHGRFCFSGGSCPGPVGSAAPRGMDGLELEDSERLGSIPVVSTGLPGAASPVSAALPPRLPALQPTPASAGGENWLGELQRLGEKMGITAEATLP